MSPLPDSNHIVHFFLDLYRLQVGLPEPDPRLMSARALTDPNNFGETTYELKVSHRGKTSSRRMSLCRLGDEAVSKSVCYKVIYDDLLVLKVPPEPVVDFDQYLQSIELERRISNRLSPEVACISPSLAAILKKNPAFRNDDDLPRDAYEKSIIHHLKQSPSLQRYLKIRGTFVLFMSLSKHLFFDQVISKMHRQGELLSDTIAGSIDTMGDIFAFEAAFGAGKDNLFFRFMDLQHHYLLSMDQLLRQHGKDSNDIPEYRKKQWMFDQLAGKNINNERYHLSEAFILDRKRVGKRIFSRQKKAITPFIQLIQSDIQNSRENRNRNIAGGIISNLVELLLHLKEKNAAIRDLKPDNMFLVGNSNNPDSFPSSAESYSLGLIDLETSVNFHKTEVLEQPILAGTPFFATPSHVFENDILEKVFGDAPRTLYLQDWFAAVGIIYNVVTGKTLFEKTGQLLWEVVRMRSKAITNDEPLEDVLKNTSWVFWHTACAEFREMMTSEASAFKNISLSLGTMEMDMLLEETRACEQLLPDQIEQCILDQSIFKGEKAHKSMHMAGAEKIAGITAHHLICRMFRLVFFFMYRPEWSNRKHPEIF